MFSSQRRRTPFRVATRAALPSRISWRIAKNCSRYFFAGLRPRDGSYELDRLARDGDAELLLQALHDRDRQIEPGQPLDHVFLQPLGQLAVDRTGPADRPVAHRGDARAILALLHGVARWFDVRGECLRHAQAGGMRCRRVSSRQAPTGTATPGVGICVAGQCHSQGERRRFLVARRDARRAQPARLARNVNETIALETKKGSAPYAAST